MKRLTLIILIFILVFTVPFKFGILGGDRAYEFPKFVPIVIGIFELTAGILLVFKKTRKWGAMISIAIFSGAILAHIFILGIFYGKILFFLSILGLSLSIRFLDNQKKKI